MARLQGIDTISPSSPGAPTRSAGPEPGFTVLELLVVLALLGVLTAGALPGLSAVRDAMAVRGAREAAVGALARARLLAVLDGGAELLVRESPPGLVVRSAARTALVLDLEGGYGVELEIPGRARRAELRFDALGLGRMTSRTLRFRRRSAQAALGISSYGRVQRR